MSFEKMSSIKQSPVPTGNPNNHSSSLLPMWMRQSLDHFNTKTNLEDFGTSPPENESVFLHEPLHNYSLTHLQTKKNEQSPCAPSSLTFKAKEIKPRTGPHHHQQMLTSYTHDQVCPQMTSLTPSAPLSEAGSAATTPSVTPQHSPTLIRKILAADLTASNASHCKAGGSTLDGSRIAKYAPVTRVTNFDLNAVSPTSW